MDWAPGTDWTDPSGTTCDGSQVDCCGYCFGSCITDCKGTCFDPWASGYTDPNGDLCDNQSQNSFGYCCGACLGAGQTAGFACGQTGFSCAYYDIPSNSCADSASANNGSGPCNGVFSINDAGVWSYTDPCGNCVSSNNPPPCIQDPDGNFCSYPDCAGYCGGSAQLDYFGVCNGPCNDPLACSEDSYGCLYDNGCGCGSSLFLGCNGCQYDPYYFDCAGNCYTDAFGGGNCSSLSRDSLGNCCGTYTFTNTYSDNFSDAQNWSGGIVPTTINNVIIDGVVYQDNHLIGLAGFLSVVITANGLICDGVTITSANLTNSSNYTGGYAEKYYTEGVFDTNINGLYFDYYPPTGYALFNNGVTSNFFTGGYNGIYYTLGVADNTFNGSAENYTIVNGSIQHSTAIFVNGSIVTEPNMQSGLNPNEVVFNLIGLPWFATDIARQIGLPAFIKI